MPQGAAPQCCVILSGQQCITNAYYGYRALAACVVCALLKDWCGCGCARSVVDVTFLTWRGETGTAERQLVRPWWQAYGIKKTELKKVELKAVRLKKVQALGLQADGGWMGGQTQSKGGKGNVQAQQWLLWYVIFSIPVVWRDTC